MFSEFQIGAFTVHMYGLMMGIGFLSAYLLCDYRAKKRNLSENIIFGLLWSAIIGGMIGSRVIYYIVEIKAIIIDPSILWNFSSGYVVYGGIMGGTVVSMIYCKNRKVRFITYFDLVMPAVAMAQGFGRIGCFLAGCCYGRETDSIIGITYHTSLYAPNGVKLIPTQLISSGGDFLFAIILLMYAKKKRTDGKVASLYLILYSIGRFMIEFLRNDYRGNIGLLSTSQIISIGILSVGIVMYLLSNKGVFLKKDAKTNKV